MTTYNYTVPYSLNPTIGHDSNTPPHYAQFSKSWNILKLTAGPTWGFSFTGLTVTAFGRGALVAGLVTAAPTYGPGGAQAPTVTTPSVVKLDQANPTAAVTAQLTQLYNQGPFDLTTLSGYVASWGFLPGQANSLYFNAPSVNGVANGTGQYNVAINNSIYIVISPYLGEGAIEAGSVNLWLNETH